MTKAVIRRNSDSVKEIFFTLLSKVEYRNTD